MALTIPQPKGSTYVIPVSGLPGGNVIAGASAPSLPFGADYCGLTWSGGFVTVAVYKTGGSGGTTVATLTFANDGTNYTSITQS